VITLQNEITEHAREWDEHQRDESYLYTGARLVNAKEKLETKKLTLSGLTQQFVLTSIDSEEGKHRTKRRERLVVRGILATAILLIIALSYSPLRSSWLNQQAKSDEMIAFQKDGYALGDSKANVAPKEYLANNIYPIEAFSIDSYPVTNKRFNLCVEAGICRRPNALKSEYANIKNTDKLVVNITALDAAEFCAWLGMRLPSEKEWEVAAKAGAFKPISPDALNNNLFDFYEFTSSSFDKEGIEWTDISMDPPGILVLRGGQLNINEPFKSYLTKREQIIPTQAIQVVGFRCAFDR
jgi:formylglycine-generating enzyme required for sulfatase activity